MLSSSMNRLGDNLGHLGGLGGEHIKGLVQVAVGGLEADGVVAGEVSDRGALAHEPQQQDRLGEVAQRAAASAGADPGAVSGQQNGDGLGQAAGDIEAGVADGTLSADLDAPALAARAHRVLTGMTVELGRHHRDWPGPTCPNAFDSWPRHLLTKASL